MLQAQFLPGSHQLLLVFANTTDLQPPGYVACARVAGRVQKDAVKDSGVRVEMRVANQAFPLSKPVSGVGVLESGRVSLGHVNVKPSTVAH